ncbi:MAG: undecaprenyl-diphosphate phosphatase, partial [Oscillospiraceae bacterium]|nr:undecaprenyl-diphosphate phosphatase [Oscillospiraceae bacterium]
LFVEKLNKTRGRKIHDVDAIDFKTAILIGAFQCLSLIPGTSRSGATILGAILLGVSRSAGAEFSFFLAIPTMLGASLLKVLKYGKDILVGEAAMPTGTEGIVLFMGCLVSFGVSLLVIKALMEYVRKRSFSAFGIYRIALGAVVIGYFLAKTVI